MINWTSIVDNSFPIETGSTLFTVESIENSVADHFSRSISTLHAHKVVGDKNWQDSKRELEIILDEINEHSHIESLRKIKFLTLKNLSMIYDKEGNIKNAYNLALSAIEIDDKDQVLLNRLCSLALDVDDLCISRMLLFKIENSPVSLNFTSKYLHKKWYQKFHSDRFSQNMLIHNFTSNSSYFHLVINLQTKSLDVEHFTNQLCEFHRNVRHHSQEMMNVNIYIGIRDHKELNHDTTNFNTNGLYDNNSLNSCTNSTASVSPLHYTSSVILDTSLDKVAVPLLNPNLLDYNIEQSNVVQGVLGPLPFHSSTSQHKSRTSVIPIDDSCSLPPPAMSQTKDTATTAITVPITGKEARSQEVAKKAITTITTRSKILSSGREYKPKAMTTLIHQDYIYSGHGNRLVTNESTAEAGRNSNVRGASLDGIDGCHGASGGGGGGGGGGRHGGSVESRCWEVVKNVFQQSSFLDSLSDDVDLVTFSENALSLINSDNELTDGMNDEILSDMSNVNKQSISKENITLISGGNNGKDCLKDVSVWSHLSYFVEEEQRELSLSCSSNRIYGILRRLTERGEELVRCPPEGLENDEAVDTVCALDVHVFYLSLISGSVERLLRAHLSSQISGIEHQYTFHEPYNETTMGELSPFSLTCSGIDIMFAVLLSWKEILHYYTSSIYTLDLLLMMKPCEVLLVLECCLDFVMLVDALKSARDGLNDESIFEKIRMRDDVKHTNRSLPYRELQDIAFHTVSSAVHHWSSASTVTSFVDMTCNSDTHPIDFVRPETSRLHELRKNWIQVNYYYYVKARSLSAQTVRVHASTSSEWYDSGISRATVMDLVKKLRTLMESDVSHVDHTGDGSTTIDGLATEEKCSKDMSHVAKPFLLTLPHLCSFADIAFEETIAIDWIGCKMHLFRSISTTQLDLICNTQYDNIKGIVLKRYSFEDYTCVDALMSPIDWYNQYHARNDCAHASNVQVQLEGWLQEMVSRVVPGVPSVQSSDSNNNPCHGSSLSMSRSTLRRLMKSVHISMPAMIDCVKIGFSKFIHQTREFLLKAELTGLGSPENHSNLSSTSPQHVNDILSIETVLHDSPHICDMILFETFIYLSRYEESKEWGQLWFESAMRSYLRNYHNLFGILSNYAKFNGPEMDASDSDHDASASHLRFVLRHSYFKSYFKMIQELTVVLPIMWGCVFRTTFSSVNTDHVHVLQSHGEIESWKQTLHANYVLICTLNHQMVSRLSSVIVLSDVIPSSDLLSTHHTSLPLHGEYLQLYTYLQFSHALYLSCKESLCIPTSTSPCSTFLVGLSQNTLLDSVHFTSVSHFCKFEITNWLKSLEIGSLVFSTSLIKYIRHVKHYSQEIDDSVADMVSLFNLSRLPHDKTLLSLTNDTMTHISGSILESNFSIDYAKEPMWRIMLSWLLTQIQGSTTSIDKCYVKHILYYYVFSLQTDIGGISSLIKVNAKNDKLSSHYKILKYFQSLHRHVLPSQQNTTALETNGPTLQEKYMFSKQISSYSFASYILTMLVDEGRTQLSLLPMPALWGNRRSKKDAKQLYNKTIVSIVRSLYLLYTEWSRKGMFVYDDGEFSFKLLCLILSYLSRYFQQMDHVNQYDILQYQTVKRRVKGISDSDSDSSSHDVDDESDSESESEDGIDDSANSLGKTDPWMSSCTLDGRGGRSEQYKEKKLLTLMTKLAGQLLFDLFNVSVTAGCNSNSTISLKKSLPFYFQHPYPSMIHIQNDETKDFHSFAYYILRLLLLIETKIASISKQDTKCGLNWFYEQYCFEHSRGDEVANVSAHFQQQNALLDCFIFSCDGTMRSVNLPQLIKMRLSQYVHRSYKCMSDTHVSSSSIKITQSVTVNRNDNNLKSTLLIPRQQDVKVVNIAKKYSNSNYQAHIVDLLYDNLIRVSINDNLIAKDIQIIHRKKYQTSEEPSCQMDNCVDDANSRNKWNLQSECSAFDMSTEEIRCHSYLRLYYSYILHSLSIQCPSHTASGTINDSNSQVSSSCTSSAICDVSIWFDMFDELHDLINICIEDISCNINPIRNIDDCAKKSSFHTKETFSALFRGSLKDRSKYLLDEIFNSSPSENGSDDNTYEQVLKGFENNRNFWCKVCDPKNTHSFENTDDIESSLSQHLKCMNFIETFSSDILHNSSLDARASQLSEILSNESNRTSTNEKSDYNVILSFAKINTYVRYLCNITEIVEKILQSVEEVIVESYRSYLSSPSQQGLSDLWCHVEYKNVLDNKLYYIYEMMTSMCFVLHKVFYAEESSSCDVYHISPRCDMFLELAYQSCSKGLNLLHCVDSDSPSTPFSSKYILQYMYPKIIQKLCNTSIQLDDSHIFPLRSNSDLSVEQLESFCHQITIPLPVDKSLIFNSYANSIRHSLFFSWSACERITQLTSIGVNGNKLDKRYRSVIVCEYCFLIAQNALLLIELMNTFIYASLSYNIAQSEVPGYSNSIHAFHEVRNKSWSQMLSVWMSAFMISNEETMSVLLFHISPAMDILRHHHKNMLGTLPPSHVESILNDSDWLSDIDGSLKEPLTSGAKQWKDLQDTMDILWRIVLDSIVGLKSCRLYDNFDFKSIYKICHINIYLLESIDNTSNLVDFVFMPFKVKVKWYQILSENLFGTSKQSSVQTVSKESDTIPITSTNACEAVYLDTFVGVVTEPSHGETAMNLGNITSSISQEGILEHANKALPTTDISTINSATLAVSSSTAPHHKGNKKHVLEACRGSTRSLYDKLVVSEMHKLFNKKRSQIVAIWTHEGGTQKLDYCLQKQFDNVKYKYIMFYCTILITSKAIHKITELLMNIINNCHKSSAAYPQYLCYHAIISYVHFLRKEYSDSLLHAQLQLLVESVYKILSLPYYNNTSVLGNSGNTSMNAVPSSVGAISGSSTVVSSNSKKFLYLELSLLFLKYFSHLVVSIQKLNSTMTMTSASCVSGNLGSINVLGQSSGNSIHLEQSMHEGGSLSQLPPPSLDQNMLSAVRIFTETPIRALASVSNIGVTYSNAYASAMKYFSTVIGVKSANAKGGSQSSSQSKKKRSNTNVSIDDFGGISSEGSSRIQLIAKRKKLSAINYVKRMLLHYDLPTLMPSLDLSSISDKANAITTNSSAPSAASCRSDVTITPSHGNAVYVVYMPSMQQHAGSLRSPATTAVMSQKLQKNTAVKRSMDESNEPTISTAKQVDGSSKSVHVTGPYTIPLKALHKTGVSSQKLTEKKKRALASVSVFLDHANRAGGGRANGRTCAGSSSSSSCNNSSAVNHLPSAAIVSTQNRNVPVSVPVSRIEGNMSETNPSNAIAKVTSTSTSSDAPPSKKQKTQATCSSGNMSALANQSTLSSNHSGCAVVSTFLKQVLAKVQPTGPYTISLKALHKTGVSSQKLTEKKKRALASVSVFLDHANRAGGGRANGRTCASSNINGNSSNNSKSSAVNQTNPSNAIAKVTSTSTSSDAPPSKKQKTQATYSSGNVSALANQSTLSSNHSKPLTLTESKDETGGIETVAQRIVRERKEELMELAKRARESQLQRSTAKRCRNKKSVASLGIGSPSPVERKESLPAVHSATCTASNGTHNNVPSISAQQQQKL